jgi:hypothetical protein
MDRREKFDKRGSSEEVYAKPGEYDRTEDTAADSWFKQRLNHVRNEARKELRKKVIRIGRGNDAPEES